ANPLSFFHCLLDRGHFKMCLWFLLGYFVGSSVSMLPARTPSVAACAATRSMVEGFPATITDKEDSKEQPQKISVSG
ncbi:MAG: hypothetical protein LUH45_07340, partial [Clostridiales bacterium]|nr:hypothetical protein [Clostridiales bacterium]